jgi:hypothetical protein
MEYAVLGGHQGIVEYLLNEGFRLKVCDLFSALSNDHIDLFKFIYLKIQPIDAKEMQGLIKYLEGEDEHLDWIKQQSALLTI